MATNTTTKPAVILVADDDEAQRMLVKLGLEEDRYEVIETADGLSAVHLFEQVRPTIVLLDMNMPELNGLDACRAIRRLPGGQKIPILLITVVDDQETIDQTFEAGATDYITKPFNKAILRQRIRKFIQASRADKLREDLVKMLVHDMKTPITAIKLGSELMLDEGGSDAGMLELIRDNSLRLLNLVMGVLDASRLQEGKLTLNRTTRNVCEVLGSVADSFSWMKITRAITVRVENCDPTISATLDWILIERVLINLITNAFKHSPNESEILLSAQRIENESPMLQIAVQDQGEGISPMDHDRIFNEFTQAIQKNTGSWLDTGLGLTFCKLAVEEHGGTITLKSALGAGARFTLNLPISQPT